MTMHNKSLNRKIVLIYTRREKTPASLTAYMDSLELALQTAGAEVERLDLDTSPDILLDHLEAGALTVVIKKVADSHHQ